MEACQQEEWVWEPQAPQMPHSNVLNLSVFPAISRRHCAIVRKTGGLHVVKEDTIWEAAQQVWADLPNCKIARGYVHAYRLMEKVIADKGDNAFLGKEKGLSCEIRKDFHDTLWGIRRKDGKTIAPPPAIKLPHINHFGAAGREAAVEVEAGGGGEVETRGEEEAVGEAAEAARPMGATGGIRHTEEAAAAEAVRPSGAAREAGTEAEFIQPSGAATEAVRPTGATRETRPTGETAEEVRPPGTAAEAIRPSGAARDIRQPGAVEVIGRNNSETAAVTGFVPREEIPKFISDSEMVARVKRARALAMGIPME